MQPLENNNFSGDTLANDDEKLLKMIKTRQSKLIVTSDSSDAHEMNTKTIA